MTVFPINSRSPNPVSWNDEGSEETFMPEAETPPHPDSPESPLRILSRKEERELKILDAYFDVVLDPDFVDDPHAFVAKWIARLESREYSSYELEVLERVKQEISF